ncbi:serine/threonine-protein kinase [Deinococcus sp. QL22]|uniref:serine/threonine-protein kinase n=1 Tax=Deinococcus sp. QL22 TaxID=2939437 RepID=UPI002017A1CA|nr:serine/threonine-protein kinase [Deinococcus sp. QL22]UQN07178.1 serine/threonine protein kinase [Deinococcus sp. QL22]
MTESPAISIPGYTLLQQLGRGNTSLVRLAVGPDGREVALKIPLPETLAVHDAAERFGNEVRLTLQFRHPHLVTGYAGTPFGPLSFLAIRYYPQGALNEHLARLPGRMLPLDASMRLLADIASALTYLHHLGAVHQDVKTQNVYISEGRAALGDLGNTYFTSQGGKVSGSPFYMAPEIYHGEGSSGASDVYSLGIMMYELLWGQRPFTGNTYEELMVAHMTRFPPPLVHLNPQVARNVSRMAELALAKRPHDRPTADAIRRALLTAMGETPQDEHFHELEEAAPPTPTGQRAGRHGMATPRVPLQPTPSVPAPAKAPEAPAKGWNPFKRTKK